MASNNVASWTAGTILFGGKELHSVSAGSTFDATPVGIGGNMVDHALAGAGRYIVFWEKANPSIFQTVLESAYVSDDDRIIVMELTGSATGGDVQIQSRDASHEASDKLNAESFNKIVAGNFSTGAMTGALNPTYREPGVTLTVDGIKMWSDLASQTTVLPNLTLNQDDGLSFYTPDNNTYLMARFTGNYLKFYNQSAVVASDATTMAAFGASTLTFYDNVGFGAGNKTIEIVSTDTTIVGGVTGANNGLYIYGLTNNATIPTDGSNLIMFNDGSTNRSNIGLWQSGSNEWLQINGITAGVYISSAASGFNQGSIWLDASLSGGLVVISNGSSGFLALDQQSTNEIAWLLPTSNPNDGDVLTAATVTPLVASPFYPATTQLSWAAPTGGSGDITSVVAGTNLTGGGTSGDVTLALSATLTVPTLISNASLKIHGGAGSAGIPTYSFTADTDTGINNPSADHLSLTAGSGSVAVSEAVSSGVSYMGVYPANGGDGTWSNGTSTAPWTNLGAYPTTSGWYSQGFNAIIGYYMRAGDGAPTYPTMSFYNDITTGFYRIASGQVGYSSSGTSEFYFDGGIYPATNSSGGTAGESLGTGSQAWHLIHGYTLYMYNSAATTGTDLIVTSSGQIAKKSSSIQYKDNVKELVFDSSKLDKLRPVSYDYKLDNAPDIGLIAEEVNEVFPELINYDKEGKAESIKYHGLSVMLLEEVKNLRKEVKELKEKN